MHRADDVSQRCAGLHPFSTHFPCRCPSLTSPLLPFPLSPSSLISACSVLLLRARHTHPYIHSPHNRVSPGLRFPSPSFRCLSPALAPP